MSKSPVEMNLDERKLDLIWHIFIDPADGNYLTARWAYEIGLFYQFYWDAAQSIEKYLKAFLVLNDHSVRSYTRHNLLDLYNPFLQIAGNIFPEHIEIPGTTALGGEYWHGKQRLLFIEYINKFGAADNRYGSHGTFINGPVIHILDQICCDLRKCMRRKNFYNSDLYDANNDICYFYDQADAEKEWMLSPTFLLERLYRELYHVGQSQPLRRVFSNMNLNFFDERNADESTFGGYHAIGSPVQNHLVRLLEQKDGVQNYMSKEQRKHNRTVVPQLKEWAKEMIYFSGPVAEALKLR